MPKAKPGNLSTQRQALADQRAKLLAELDARDAELAEKQLDAIREHARKLGLHQLDDAVARAALTELAERAKDPREVERWARAVASGDSRARHPERTSATAPRIPPEPIAA